MEKTLKPRRNFLVALGLGGIAAAAAVAGNPVKAAEAMQETAAPARKKGYQASEHVKRYYRSTRI